MAKLIDDLAHFSGMDDLVVEVGHKPNDLLVNNAGIAVVKPFAEITRKEWEQYIGVNVTAPFFLIQHFAPRMPPGSGIVNILSLAAKNAYPTKSVYCGIKVAMDGLPTAIA